MSGERTMTSIYEQEIYLNNSRCGVCAWHVVHHVTHNAKLRSDAERQNLVREYLLLVGVS